GYAADTDRVPDASRISPPVAPPGRSGHDISLRVALDAGAPIGELTVPSHDAQRTRTSESTARIQLAPHETIPNRDFVMRWTVDPTQVATRLLTHRQPGADGYLTLMLQSDSEPPPDEVTKREIVFVLDTSGSMYGEPMSLSKDLMEKLVGDLTE